MTVYKFVWKSCGTDVYSYENDADAMMAARKLLTTMKIIKPQEQVQVYAQIDNGKYYRFIVAYK